MRAASGLKSASFWRPPGGPHNGNNHLQSALADLTQQPRLSEQTRQVQKKYFTEHERLRGRLLGALKEQGTPLITAPEWFLHATPAIEAMIEFGRQAGALAAENMSRTL
jgi:hypothetical protein